MRILSIDFGERRVGLAISDPTGTIAQGLETITYNSDEDLFNALEQVIEKYQVDSLVIGMPFNMNGTIGERGEATKLFIEKLQTHFGFPIYEEDERLTTSIAHQTRIKMGKKLRGKKKKQKGKIDRMAATLILQGFLDKNHQ